MAQKAEPSRTQGKNQAAWLQSLTPTFRTAMPLKDDPCPLFKLRVHLLSTQAASEGEGQTSGNL